MKFQQNFINLKRIAKKNFKWECFNLRLLIFLKNRILHHSKYANSKQKVLVRLGSQVQNWVWKLQGFWTNCYWCMLDYPLFVLHLSRPWSLICIISYISNICWHNHIWDLGRSYSAMQFYCPLVCRTMSRLKIWTLLT